MRLLRSYQSLSPSLKGCIATIGNFDGMHLGHQALLNEVLAQAKKNSARSCVILFEPHPKEFFAADSSPARLMSFREKVNFLKEYGIDSVLLLRFDRSMALLSANDFVQQILVHGLGIQTLVIGHDFRFGHQRKGSVDTLQAFADKQLFGLISLPPFLVDGCLVSSTVLRQRLEVGDFDHVAQLLGRRYQFVGVVRSGVGEGRQLGFPTANLVFQYRVMPLSGVFAAEVIDESGQKYISAVSVGFRPFFGGGERMLEAHLLDYSGSLYGKVLSVDFRTRLRDQWNFPTLDALKAQISRDVATVRAFFEQGE